MRTRVGHTDSCQLRGLRRGMMQLMNIRASGWPVQQTQWGKRFGDGQPHVPYNKQWKYVEAKPAICKAISCGMPSSAAPAASRRRWIQRSAAARLWMAAALPPGPLTAVPRCLSLPGPSETPARHRVPRRGAPVAREMGRWVSAAAWGSACWRSCSGTARCCDHAATNRLSDRKQRAVPRWLPPCGL